MHVHLGDRQLERPLTADSALERRGVKSDAVADLRNFHGQLPQARRYGPESGQARIARAWPAENYLQKDAYTTRHAGQNLRMGLANGHWASRKLPDDVGGTTEPIVASIRLNIGVAPLQAVIGVGCAVPLIALDQLRLPMLDLELLSFGERAGANTGRA